MNVDVPGRYAVNEGRRALSLAQAGVGLMYSSDRLLQTELKRGALKLTLAPYASKGAPFYLYYAARSKNQPKLRAFIECLLSVALPTRKKSKPAR